MTFLTDTFLGDFIITHDFVSVFLVDTKTDTYKSDQWTTFVSPTETSAYTLLQNLVKNILTNASEELLKSGKFSYYVQIFERVSERP
jgi:hypothetical protein